jgi:hypothetical protein
MNADAEALLEQALQHVLEETGKLLKRDDIAELLPLVSALNALASATSKARAKGVHRLKSVESLVKLAMNCESESDIVSEKIWKPLQVSVTSIYQKIESSLKPHLGKSGAATELRTHYDKIRIRLLQQSLGAKMLENSNDRGAEIERVWQQFLQNALGDSVRVLQGGVICDYEGNASAHQIDLIVVPTQALVTFPSGAEDGKVHVPVDQVISAIMVTSNLESAKLVEDWAKLAAIPKYVQKAEPNDHPQLKDHPWPLRYIVGSQSDPIEKLRDAWLKAAAAVPDPAPEFVVTLDSGFLLSGATRWPRPRHPQGQADDVSLEEGVYAGLGLAWLLLQHQGRLAVLDRRALGPINRQAEALNYAGLKEATPATWSPRYDSMFRSNRIAGCMGWGRFHPFAHNKLPLNSFMIANQGDLYLGGIDPKTLDFHKWHEHVRLFRYPSACQGGVMLALEEWIDARSKGKAHSRIALFNSTTGEEVFDHGFTSVTDVVKFGPISWPRKFLDLPDSNTASAPATTPSAENSSESASK